MKKLIPLCCALVVFAASMNVPVRVQAQQTGPIAIVDVLYIFKNHARFKTMHENMKREGEQAEAELKTADEEIERMIEQLRGFKPGSADFKSLDEEVTQRRAMLSAKLENQRKDFAQRQAKMFYAVYQEVSDEVKYYAERNNIQLVLRFNGDEIDPSHPQEMWQDINKFVVFYSSTIDITPVILEALNRKAGTQDPPRTTSNQGRPPRGPQTVPPRRN